jgi:phosphatidylglycerol:prolipoprotein diacylglycerol transferase
MESIGLFVLFTFLLKKGKRKPYNPGEIISYYLIFSGLLRFVVEFFRGDDRGKIIFGMAPTAYMAITIIIFGILLKRYGISHKSKPALEH